MTRALPHRAIRTLAPAPKRGLRARLLTSAALAASAVALVQANPARAQLTSGFQGAPEVVVPGSASVVQSPGADTITVNAPQAVINWTPNDRTGTGNIDFLPLGASARFTGSQEFTVLNRIIPRNAADVPVARMIELNGAITSDVNGGAGGNVWFYSPGGIMVGSGAVINVGSLVLTNRDIDTTGGLFGTRNEIRFRDSGIAGTNSSEINIAAGAQILSNRTDGSAYIALVAPRIVQNGTINADGSIALVAAESADITINNGLFDISVFVGTTDAHGIEHGGVTGGPSDHSANYDSRAYFVAVPQSQMMTMLLSGTIGFADARSATVTPDGGIVLSAGRSVVRGQTSPSSQVGDASISVRDIIFRNNLVASATGSFTGRPNSQCFGSCSTSSSQGIIGFGGNVNISAARSIDFGVGTSQLLSVAGDMTLRAGTPEQGGTINLSLIDNQPPSSTGGGGAISVTGRLTLDVVGRGDDDGIETDGLGGTINLTVDGGTFNAGALIIDATGYGGLFDERDDPAAVGPLASPMGAPADGDGGDGVGGTVTMNITNGAVVTLGSLDLHADGIADIYAQNSGDGIGGSASLSITNGARVNVTGTTNITAIGLGYIGGISSGDGTGGSVTVNITGVDSALISAVTVLDASGIGGGALGQEIDPIDGSSRVGPRGGDGAGGNVSFTNSATNVRFSGTDLGSLRVAADGAGGGAFPASPTDGRGGAGQGGTINFTIDGTAMRASDALFSAVGVAGQSGGGTGEFAEGGLVNISVLNGGNWTIDSDLTVDAGGILIDNSGGDHGALDGGEIGLLLDSGTLSAANMNLIANAGVRGNGTTMIPNSSSDAEGGDISLRAVNGSNLNIGLAFLDTNARAEFANGLAGSALGGTIAIQSESGSRMLFSGLNINAAGFGGSGDTAGAGRGGDVSIGIDDAAILVRGDLFADASGQSGLSSGATRPGDAQGGNFSFDIAGSTAQFLATNFGISVDGGAAFSTLVGLPGIGADGRGGGINFNLNDGAVSITNLDASAAGFGAGGGNGFGGTTNFLLGGGTHSITSLTLGAVGAGSSSGPGADAGTGTGGTVNFTALAGGSGDLTSQTINFFADGSGGRVGTDVPGLRGSRLNGGDGNGGTINIQLDGGHIAVTSGLFANANGNGANGSGFSLSDSSPMSDLAPPGRGGRGTGGTVNFNFTGGGLDVGSTGLVTVELNALGIGGNAGRITNMLGPSSTLRLPNDPGGVAGGDGIGGTVNVNLSTDGALVAMTADVSGKGGIGGFGISGGAGGRGSGGTASIDIDDFDFGFDGSTYAVVASGEGGAGGDAINGRGGAGGEGAGGHARFTATGTDGRFAVDPTSLILTGIGGAGGAGMTSSLADTPLTTGFDGGRGGDGKGGELELHAVDGALVAINNLFSSTTLRIEGFGGAGGTGATLLSGGSGATTGGRGGDGGNGYGGNFRLTAEGGTIGYAAGEEDVLELISSGVGGAAGLGGDGTTQNVLDGNGNVIGTTGGRGSNGLTGLGFGGLIRAVAGDTGAGEGVIRATDLRLDASSQIAGRIEIIDDSGASGFDVTNLRAEAFGGPITSSDFTIVGSGIYLTSTDGMMQFGSAYFGTNGTVRFDMSGSGGLSILNDLTVETNDFILNHANPTSGAVSLAAGTIVATATGGIFLNAGSTLSSVGITSLDAGGDIFVASADVGDAFTVNAGNNVNITSSYSYADTRITAGDNVTLDDVQSRTSGMYQPGESSDLLVTAGGDVSILTQLIGRNITVDAANIRGMGDSQFYAPGDIMFTADGVIDLSGSSLSAGNDVRFNAGTDIYFGSIDGDDITLTAGGTINGVEISADNGVTINANGNLVSINTIAAQDDVIITAANADVRGDSLSTQFGGVSITGRNVDYGDIFSAFTLTVNASGTIHIDNGVTDPDAAQGASAGSGFGIGTMGLGEGGTADIILIAGGAVTVGRLDAADRISINAASLGAPDALLFAGDDIDVRVTGSAQFDGLFANSGINVIAGDRISGTNVEVSNDGAPVSLNGANGVTVEGVYSRGLTDLRANNGLININNLVSFGLISFNAQGGTIIGSELLDFSALNATSGNASVRNTDGDINIRAGNVSGDVDLRTLAGDISVQALTGGNITLNSSDSMILGAVTARNALNGTAVDLVNVSGVTTGQTISLVSGDIAIGTNGRVGTAGTTTGVTLRNGDVTARTFIGGSDQAGEYSLSAAEIARVFGGDITIIGPRVQAQSGGSVGSTRPPDVVIGAFTFNGGGASGGNLSAGGTLSIQTNGAARVIGAVAGSNMTAGNGFEIAADDAIEVILGQGSIRLTGGGSNGLGGTLRLQSADIAVASMTAITDIAAMTDLAQIDGRLAQNDGVTDDMGALSGNRLELDVRGGAYIQNSGVDSSYANRRGFTANILAVTTANANSNIIINGRIGDVADVLQTGIDAIAFALINGAHPMGQGQFAAGSTINGCPIANPASCRVTFNYDSSFPVQDTVNEQVDDEDGTSSAIPQVLIDLREVDDLTDQPIIDEPITGSGNDDLWSPPEDMPDNP